MTDPTDEYLRRQRLVSGTIGDLGLESSGLEAKFECLDDNLPPMAQLPDHVKFYDGKKVVGQLYFMEEPMRLLFEDSFTKYAQQIMKKLGY